MSAREEQPATVPPPAGEDDAYSATTKVGAMPSDIMEKLRAEGLLPEEAERETPVASMRPNSSLTPRTPVPPESDGAPVPQLFSVVPGAPSSPPSDAPPDDRVSTKITAAPPAPPPEAVETPIAFASPPALPALPSISEERQDTTAVTRPQVPKPPSKTTMYLVAAVVVVLLIVALLRLRG